MINQSLEEINLARDRSLLIIKARWFLTLLLFVYAAITAYLYSGSSSKIFYGFGEIYFAITALILVNSFLHLTYTYKKYLWRYKINSFIITQLAVDLFFSLAFIYFTGGILSWFWILLVIFSVELTYILPDIQTILTVTIISMGSYALLIFGEYFELIPQAKLLFFKSGIHTNLSYVIIVSITVTLINLVTALFCFSYRIKEEPNLTYKVNRDSQTKLYNRKRFNDFLNSEVFRAIRYNRVVSLMMIKIENLDELIDKLSLKESDRIFAAIGNNIKNNLRRSDTNPSYDIDIACRFDKDIFAVILPETQDNDTVIPAERLESIIKNQCAKISNGVSLSISIGISSYPNSCKDSKSMVKNTLEALKRSKVYGRIEKAKAINKKEEIIINK